jgi:hypothetical protein
MIEGQAPLPPWLGSSIRSISNGLGKILWFGSSVRQCARNDRIFPARFWATIRSGAISYSTMPRAKQADQYRHELPADAPLARHCRRRHMRPSRPPTRLQYPTHRCLNSVLELRRTPEGLRAKKPVLYERESALQPVDRGRDCQRRGLSCFTGLSRGANECVQNCTPKSQCQTENTFGLVLMPGARKVSAID